MTGHDTGVDAVAFPDDAAELLERHRRVIPSWIALYYDEPIELVKGEGTRVWDSSGKEYLDFFGGIVTTISGHAVEELVKALQEQAGKLVHTSTLYLIRPMIELAEKLTGKAPIDGDTKAFFVGSGTEAVEAALLFATQYRRSNQILALRNSYHGRSFGAMGVTGNRGWSASSLTPLNVQYAMPAYCYRCPLHLTYPSCGVACAEDVRNVIETTTSGDVAAMIAEPIQGVGGFVTPPPEYFARPVWSSTIVARANAPTSTISWSHTTLSSAAESEPVPEIRRVTGRSSCASARTRTTDAPPLRCRVSAAR